MGLIHIYCGDGKGKTTAALGLAVRMAGSGRRAVIARFLKNDDSGEIKALEQIQGIQVIPSEKPFGFTWQMTEEQKREAAQYYTELLKRAFEQAEGLARESGGEEPEVLLVLDEICAAVNTGLVEEELALRLLASGREKLEIALTGRDPSEALCAAADYISRIQKKKHPFDQGIGARQGIEY